MIYVGILVFICFSNYSFIFICIFNEFLNKRNIYYNDHFVKLLETEYILLGMLVIPIYFLITIVSTVIMFISFELANIMSSLLCYNQKFRKEGYDIILRLMEIEKGSEE